MSNRYKGGIISATPPTTNGPFEDGAASGAWTLEQQMQAAAAGTWPLAGNVGPDAFIENLFQTWLYTGNGSSQTITNGIDLAGEGGLVWLKARSTTASHLLVDTVRGGGNFLSSNNSNAQTFSSSVVPSFNSDGFPTGGGADISGQTYVSWTFRKQPKFFDVVTYTGDGTSPRSIAHNLGSTAACVMVKRTDTTGNWKVLFTGLTRLCLNSTEAEMGTLTVQGGYIDNANATTFTLVSNAGSVAEVNASGGTYVAYVFASNAGGFGLTGTDNVISCGAFTGNTTVNLGYEPQWVLVKNYAGADSWTIMDNMRGMPVTGFSQALLRPNTSGAEGSGAGVFPTATGFTTTAYSGLDCIYIAIRRGPMKTPTTGTSVFAPFNTSVTSNPLAFNTNFPVDFMLTRRSNLAGDQVATSRLQGGLNLDTTSTSAEQSPSYFTFTSNTSVSSSYFNTGFGSVQSMLGFQRAPSYMDVVCYTGNGTDNRAVAHNLTVAPELVIVKCRSNGADPWAVLQTGIPTYLRLNAIDASRDPASQFGNSTTMVYQAPTSTNLFLAAGGLVNETARTYVAYLFATCPGVSKVGSYTGTGTLTTINCGFTGGARFVLIKKSSGVGSWFVWDTSRGMVSGTDPSLRLNSTDAEVNGNSVYSVATGFQLLASPFEGVNTNGDTYIFLAIA
jgi:hypothetical protein